MFGGWGHSGTSQEIDSRAADSIGGGVRHLSIHFQPAAQLPIHLSIFQIDQPHGIRNGSPAQPGEILGPHHRRAAEKRVGRKNWENVRTPAWEL